MTSEGMVREATDAELDAKMLREVRVLPFELRKHGRSHVTLAVEELDMLLRVADERDALRRELCDSAESKGHHGDPRYVIRSCASCGHAPHGVGLICWENNCPCRITGGITS